MAKWLALAAVVAIAAIIASAYISGRRYALREAELANAKADQAQADEAREIKNAIEKLDDTGLRDAFDKLRANRPSH